MKQHPMKETSNETTSKKTMSSENNIQWNQHPRKTTSNGINIQEKQHQMKTTSNGIHIKWNEEHFHRFFVE